eukprot:72755-Rhodomonas_salina.1
MRTAAAARCLHDGGLGQNALRVRGGVAEPGVVTDHGRERGAAEEVPKDGAGVARAAAQGRGGVLDAVGGVGGAGASAGPRGGGKRAAGVLALELREPEPERLFALEHAQPQRVLPLQRQRAPGRVQRGVAPA